MKTVAIFNGHQNSEPNQQEGRRRKTGAESCRAIKEFPC